MLTLPGQVLRQKNELIGEIGHYMGDESLTSHFPISSNGNKFFKNFKEENLEKNELITVEELAEKLKIKKNTIYYWTSRREIPYLKIGRHLRFRLSDVLKYFREKEASREDAKSFVLRKYNSSSRNNNFIKGGSLTEEYWAFDEDRTVKKINS